MIKNKRKYISKNIDIRRTRTVNKKDYSIIVVVIMIIIGILFIKLGIEVEKNTKSIYQYKIEKKSNYEVLLKENDFYVANKLPAGLYYVSKSIDDFIINFEYNVRINKKIDTQYNYSITADLVGIVKDAYEDKEVWNRSFNIVENKSDNQLNIDSFSIKEKININYEQYNNLVHSFEREYGIKIDAILKVHFNVCYQSNFGSDNIKTEKIEDVIELDIPITDTVTKVNENYENDGIVDIMPPIEKLKIKQYIYYTISGLFIISSVIILIIRTKKNKMSPQEKYEKNVNYILKYYKDIIVTVNNAPNLTNLKMMELISLDDLIDVAEQNKCHIIHYEDIKSGINHLYVIVGEYVYYYST